MSPLTGKASRDSIPEMAGLCATSLGQQGERRTVVTEGKANSGSISEMVGCVMLLLAGEMSGQRSVVAGGVMRPLTVEASGDSIPKMAGCVLLLLAGKASGKMWWLEARPAALASPWQQYACCFLVGEARER